MIRNKDGAFTTVQMYRTSHGHTRVSHVGHPGASYIHQCESHTSCRVSVNG